MISPDSVVYGYPYGGPWEQPEVYRYPYPPPPFPPAPGPGDRTPPDDNNGEPDRKVDSLAARTAQELREAWLTADIALISKHMRRDVEIRVYQAGVLKKTSDPSDLLADMRYEFDQKTSGVAIKRLQSTGPHRYNVTLVRTIRDLGGYETAHTIRYTIRRIDGVYIITDVDFDD